MEKVWQCNQCATTTYDSINKDFLWLKMVYLIVDLQTLVKIHYEYCKTTFVIFGKAFKTKNCPVPQNRLSYCCSPDTNQDSLWILQNDSCNIGKSFKTKKLPSASKCSNLMLISRHRSGFITNTWKTNFAIFGKAFVTKK
jgi:hypothetical protein